MNNFVKNEKLIPIKEISLEENFKLQFSTNEINIASSAINKFGIPFPLVLDFEKHVVLGEIFYLAALKLKLEEVPAVFIENLKPKELKAFKIAFSKIQKFGDFDFEELKSNVLDIINDDELDFNFEELGFDAVSFDNLLFVEDKNEKTTKEDDEIVINKIKEVVKVGDLIQLGDHLLYCGDSLKEESYKILLGNKKADINIADAPYNVKIQNNVTKQQHHEEFENASGEMTDEEFKQFLRCVFQHIRNFSKDSALSYLFMDWRHSLHLQLSAVDAFKKFHNICIWDKTKAGMGSFYRSQHEFCFVYQNENTKHINNINLGANGRNRSNIWQYQGMNISTKQARKLVKLHPTVKPVPMLVDILLDASKPGDIVLDPFGGSGSTLIAAEQCKRKARVIEISPHYCDIIIARWEELTGKTHTILNRGNKK